MLSIRMVDRELLVCMYIRTGCVRYGWGGPDACMTYMQTAPSTLYYIIHTITGHLMVHTHT